MSIFLGEKIVKLGLFSLKTLHGIYHNHNYYKNPPLLIILVLLLHTVVWIKYFRNDKIQTIQFIID